MVIGYSENSATLSLCWWVIEGLDNFLDRLLLHTESQILLMGEMVGETASEMVAQPYFCDY